MYHYCLFIYLIILDIIESLQTSLAVSKNNVFQLFKILAEGKAVPEEMMVQVIVDRLKSPDVEHYGKDMKQLK